MRKVSLNAIAVGKQFSICDSWRAALANALKENEDTVPTIFQVLRINGYTCVCQSVSNDAEQKSLNVCFSIMTVQYLSGLEVPDCNCGLYFCDYLPTDGTKLLLSDSKGNITPVQIVLDIKQSDDVISINLMLQNLLTDAKHALVMHNSCSWKYLDKEDIYMTDIERMYQDTFIHKEIVMQVCQRFAAWLQEQDRNEEADALLLRAKVHDNSKVCNQNELLALTSLINNKSSLGNAKARLSELEEDNLELHWQNNSHHPEHYEKYGEMTTLDRMEMVCDWMARALQYKTNLMEFVQTRQKERFHFSRSMYKEVHYYCKVLVQLFNFS